MGTAGNIFAMTHGFFSCFMPEKIAPAFLMTREPFLWIDSIISLGKIRMQTVNARKKTYLPKARFSLNFSENKKVAQAVLITR